LVTGDPVTNDQVPSSFASVVGHVCGVIAVAMAALSLFGIWGLAHKVTLLGLVLVSLCIGLTALMFRWAGALTGHRDTQGRLSVHKVVYAALGVLFGIFTVFSLGLAIVRPPQSLDAGFVMAFGLVGGIALTYLCYLATQRFK